jgi:hypothetical protein
MNGWGYRENGHGLVLQTCGCGVTVRRGEYRGETGEGNLHSPIHRFSFNRCDIHSAKGNAEN